VNETTLDVSSKNIANLTGIEAFIRLQSLNCKSNLLTSLPTLPNSLQIINCGSNRLRSLPTLPNNLQDLTCFDNRLSSLPILPNSLQILNCASNWLITLPTLPDGLQSLRCGYNQIVALPTLSKSLKDLFCVFNQLTFLPVLPDSLQVILCYSNQLTSLPTLPNDLKVLSCRSNQLTFLPNLPKGLHTLECNNNPITYLPVLPSGLYTLTLDCRDTKITCIPNLPSNNPYFYNQCNLKLCSPPFITSFTPQSNQNTNQVVITGNNFGGVLSVKFNGIEASSFKVNSSTQITAIVPPNATTGKITVTYGQTGTSQEDFVIIENINKIQGKLVHDANFNCQNDNLEKGIPNIMVKAGEFYGSTDADGKYELSVPAGDYPISQLLSKKVTQIITPTCPKSYTASFSGTGETKSGFDFFNKVVDCAYLTVDIGSNRRRRCFENYTTVRYTNSGFADAENVTIHVLFPKYVRPLRSTRMWASQQDSLLVFNIGKVKAGESGQFIITDIVSCEDESIRGLTQCTKAMIFPKSACGTSPSWNKSEVSVTAACILGSIAQLTLKNTGEADMSEPTSYRIFLEGLLVKTDKIILKKGESQNIQLPAFGKTVRIEADQPAFHPQGSYYLHPHRSSSRSGKPVPRKRKLQRICILHGNQR
jgi:hypothetical protein